MSDKFRRDAFAKTSLKKWACLLILVFLALPASSQDLEKITQARPITVTGGMRFGGQYYQVSGLNARAAPFQFNASGRLNLAIYETFNIPISFAVGRMRPSLQFPVYRQFGMSPQYKWATLHAGYRNMRLSRFSLNNHTFLGAGLELHPGKLRVAAMYGRLRQGVREANENIDLLFGQPLYNRFAYGGRLGWGSDESYLDLVYFRAEDREANINLPANARLPTPAENVVVGLEWKQRIGSHLNLSAEVAASGLNRNVDSEELPLEDYPTARALDFLFTPRFSAQTGLAIRSGASYRNKGFSLGADYERIDPGFESMGTYFLNGDWENIRGRLGFGLFKQRLRLMSSLGVQRNNLNGQRAETSRRLIGSLILSLRAGARNSLNLNLANYSQDHRPSAVVILNDTLRIAATTRQLGGSWSSAGRGGKGRPLGTFTATANYQRTDNDNPLSEGFDALTTRYGGLSYSLRLANAQTTFTAGTNYTAVDVRGQQTQGLGGTLSWRQQFGKSRWQLDLTNTFNQNTVDGQSDGFSNALRGQLSWRVSKQHSLNLGFSWLERSSNSGFGFREQRANIGYAFTLPKPAPKPTSTPTTEKP